MPAAEPPLGLLFVNKDIHSESLSQSRGEVASQINRHAQLSRRHAKRQKGLDVSAGRRIASERWGTRESSPSVASKLATSPLSKSLSNQLNESKPNDDQEPTTVNEAGETQNALSLYNANFIAADSVDPFSSTAIKLDDHVLKILQYYFGYLSVGSLTYKIEALPVRLRSSNNSPGGDKSIQRYLHDEGRIYSLLAVMATRMKFTSGLQMVGSASPEYLIYRAVKALRTYLCSQVEKGEVDKDITRNMLNLACAEWACGRLESCAMHISAASNLLHLLDRNVPIEYQVLDSFYQIDILLSVDTGAPPILGMTWDPGSLSEARMLFIKAEISALQTSGIQHDNVPVQLSTNTYGSPPSSPDFMVDASSNFDLRMGSGLRAALDEGIIEPHMQQPTFDLLECVLVGKFVWLTLHANISDADWMCRKARVVIWQCLNLQRFSSFETSKSHSKMFSECLRLTLIILLMYVSTRTAFRSKLSNLERLRRSLDALYPHWYTRKHKIFCGTSKEDVAADGAGQAKQKIEDGMLLWIVLTGCFAASGDVEQDWFDLFAVNVALGLGLTDLRQLHDHMSCFIYSSRLQRPSLRRVAARIQERQRAESSPAR